MNPLAIAIFGGAATALLWCALCWWWLAASGERREVTQRLEQMAGRSAGPTETDVMRAEVRSEIPLLDRLLGSLRITSRLDLLLVQAGMSMRVGTLLLLVAVAALLLMLVARTLVDHWAAGVAGGLVGAAAPIVYIRRRRRSRRVEFARLFPGALDMIKASMQAGHALNHALEAVCEEFPDPIGGEFRQVLEELRLGLTPRAAFENLQRRIDIPDVRFFAMTVLIQRETGGNLSDILDRVAMTLRDRFKLQSHIRAVTAQGRMSMYLVGGLPLATAAVLLVMNPHYFDDLLAHPAAPAIFGFLIFLELVGFLWIRRITTLREVQVT